MSIEIQWDREVAAGQERLAILAKGLGNLDAIAIEAQRQYYAGEGLTNE